MQGDGNGFYKVAQLVCSPYVVSSFAGVGKLEAELHGLLVWAERELFLFLVPIRESTLRNNHQGDFTG